MTVTVIAMFARRPGISHEAFVSRYETAHVPLIYALLPRFGTYRRTYISDEQARSRIGFDVITEASFATQDHFEEVNKAMNNSDIARQIETDEALFMDRSRTLIFIADTVNDLEL